MNDQAAKHEARQFFTELDTIGLAMKEKLQTVFQNECYSTIQTLQLSRADLPGGFEDALSSTNVAQQQILTANQTQANVLIDMET